MLDDKKWSNLAKSKNVKFDMNIKNRIITRYCFVSIKTFQRVIINNWLEFALFSTKKVMPDMSKKGPYGIHLTNVVSDKLEQYAGDAAVSSNEI